MSTSSARRNGGLAWPVLTHSFANCVGQPRFGWSVTTTRFIGLSDVVIDERARSGSCRVGEPESACATRARRLVRGGPLGRWKLCIRVWGGADYGDDGLAIAGRAGSRPRPPSCDIR